MEVNSLTPPAVPTKIGDPAKNPALESTGMLTPEPAVTPAVMIVPLVPVVLVTLTVREPVLLFHAVTVPVMVLGVSQQEKLSSMIVKV
jgi:hypothetical protein